MAEFLVFDLYGPLASWGDTAVGEQRPTRPRPSKSALVGLLAGTLGIERQDEEAHQALNRGLGLALAVRSPGKPLTDYHTVQMPHGKDRYATRREEMVHSKRLNTVLSWRTYLGEALFRACLWQRGDAAPELGRLAKALQRPVFCPYLGRKSCPPGLPFNPRIVQAETMALALTQDSGQEDFLPGFVAPTGNMEMYWEGRTLPGDPDPGVEAVQRMSSRDSLLSRRRWQFTARTENQGYTRKEVS